VPPLRERRKDTALLSWIFVNEFCRSMGKPIKRIADESMAAMQAYPWPGNVRELRNVIKRAMIVACGPTEHVKLSHTPHRPPAVASNPGTLKEAQRAHILQVLKRCAWRIRGPEGAPALLDVKPTTLESRMKKIGLAQKPRSPKFRMASEISEGLTLSRRAAAPVWLC
jgi:formate hydrogenlyase transcriptional activator